MASTTSLSVPASSPGDRVPSPAATIRGLEMSAFGRSGSAPREARKRISSASPARARCLASPSSGRQYGLVHVGARLQQNSYHADAALANGKQERREARIRALLNIGARLKQSLHGFDVPFRRRPHERRLAAPAFL